MNRKHFINSFLPLAGVIALPGRGLQATDEDELNLPAIVPQNLKVGDEIAITCPAGFISLDAIQPAVNKMKEWGFKVRLGNAIGKRDNSFGGTDQERLADLQQLMDDKNVKAIMCARGGYGLVRIIDQLNFKKLLLYPKWIIGFSDITVMHSHLNRQYNMASIHSKMCNSFPDDWSLADQVQQESIESIRKCLTGVKMKYTTLPNAGNRMGTSKGRLVGGNLKTIESLAGTNSSMNTRNRILFLEDTGEYLYNIDRMFWNLKRSGKLSELNGLIIGGFKIKKDDEGEEFGRTLEQIVLEKVAAYKYPVCFDFPVGHQKNNFALKCGVIHSFKVTSAEALLVEL